MFYSIKRRKQWRQPAAYFLAETIQWRRKENCMSTSESKGRFLLHNEPIRIDSHERIESNRELECSDRRRLNSSLVLRASGVSYSWEFLRDGNTEARRRCQNAQLHWNSARRSPEYTQTQSDSQPVLKAHRILSTHAKFIVLLLFTLGVKTVTYLMPNL